MRRTPVSLKIKDDFVSSSPRDGSDPGQGGSSSRTVYFVDTTTGNPSSWAWIFYATNGSTILGTSNIKNPVFSFPSAGTFRVTLTTNYGTAINNVVVI